MKKVININFQGRVIPIEETSYDLLKQYTDSLRTYFANEESKDEIINDIESRIAELFQERLKAGATCITDDDINAIINNIGRPQDLADAETAADTTTASQQGSQNSYQQTTFTTGKKLYRDANNKVLGGVCSGIAAYFNVEPILVRLVFIFSGIGFIAYLFLWAFIPSSDAVKNGVRKRLYRNPDDKIIAGVCSGLASYFNINVWIPRVLFLIPFITIFFSGWHFWPIFSPFLHITFSPSTLLIYIILWIVMPEAHTTSEKLEMKGERVDINTIKNSVTEEMKGVKDRLRTVGKQGAEMGKNIGAEMGSVARRSGRSLGDFIIIMLKIFLYFLLMGFAFASFGIAIAATGIFPFKDYLIKDGWQNAMAWGTLLFFIYVPVIAIITWLIRRIARIRSNSRTMRWAFFTLWIVGWICFISLLVSVGRDFRSLNSVTEEKIALANPAVNLLEVTTNSVGKYNRFRFQPFAGIDEDTAYVDNVGIRIIKSPNDSFQVTLTKFANGRTKHYADTLASLIKFNVEQKDSSLIIDRGIPITEQDKFRNQHVVLTIAVPVGKRIKIDKKAAWWNWERFQFPWSDVGDDYDWDNESYSWSGHVGEELLMKNDGLYTPDGRPTNEWGHRRTIIKHGHTVIINDDDNGDWNNDNGGDSSNSNGYRYDKTQKQIDSLKVVKQKQIQKLKDSMLKQKQELDKNLERLNKSAGTNQEAFKDPRTYDFVLNI